ncbi:MAG: hypothetical protein VKK98_10635 [Cyanobacteriota bacterium]|nr:hypothetical protein [Cyanobacteriota bacterium]
MIISGKVQRLTGDQRPGPGSRLPPVDLSDQEIVVVAGAVQPREFGDPFLPVGHLKAPVISRGRTDALGCFRLMLDSHLSQTSQITIFLVVPGGYYLNRFDGSGSFAKAEIRQAAAAPIVLLDDRNALR